MEKKIKKLPEADVGAIELLGQFSGKLGHDLNNILGSLKGCVDIIRGRMQKLHPDQNPIERQLAIMENAIRKCTDLTTRMRGYVRPGDLVLESCDLAVLISQSSAAAKGALASSVNIVQRVEPGTSAVLNQVATQAMLVALFVNALEAADPATPDAVVCEVQAVGCDDEFPRGALCVRISDNGKGMTAEQIAAAFRPMSSKRAGAVAGGFGLTFSMAQRLMEKQGGAFGVQSRPGAGTTVSLYFQTTGV